MNLLDTNRDLYSFRWTENHDLEIMDESDNLIGDIKLSKCFLNYKWKIIDSNNSTLLIISTSWLNKFVIKDGDETVIGYVKNKFFECGASIREDVLKNKNKKLILIQKTIDLLNFEINNSEGQKVGEITPDCRGRSFRVLKIFDKSLDRKLLLGFFVNVISYFWPPPLEDMGPIA